MKKKFYLMMMLMLLSIITVFIVFNCTQPSTKTSTTTTDGTTTTSTTTTDGTTTTSTTGGTTTTSTTGGTTTTSTTTTTIAVTFVSAVQTGGTSGTADSTGLTLTFSVDPTTLAASDITVTGATKGALTGTGTTRSLAISAITVANGETVSVAIANPSGYAISGSPQTAVVYKDTRTAVTFVSAVQTGGTSGTADSTGLILTFSVDPTTLAASDITVTGATKGTLSGSGTTRSLAISNITVANGETVSVAIANPSGYDISGSPQTAVVYRDIMPGVSYRELVYITGGTYTQDNGTKSFSHTLSNFSLGQYEATYELWYTVYQWAISNGYNFANAGREGNDGTAGAAPTAAKYEPVTMINWRDTIVWLNAYSEMSGYTPCYKYSQSTIKDSQDSNATACDGAVCDWTANGYRLPSEGEWQYAASNKGMTPWDYASGATADYNDATADKKVAWYSANSGSATHTVGTTTNSSELTLWDVSGNVYELCWDWYGGSSPAGPETDYRGPTSGSYRIIRGGDWLRTADSLRVGHPNGAYPYGESTTTGFRVARYN